MYFLNAVIFQNHSFTFFIKGKDKTYRKSCSPEVILSNDLDIKKVSYRSIKIFYKDICSKILLINSWVIHKREFVSRLFSRFHYIKYQRREFL